MQPKRVKLHIPLGVDYIADFYPFYSDYTDQLVGHTAIFEMFEQWGDVDTTYQGTSVNGGTVVDSSAGSVRVKIPRADNITLGISSGVFVLDLINGDGERFPAFRGIYTVAYF